MTYDDYIMSNMLMVMNGVNGARNEVVVEEDLVNENLREEAEVEAREEGLREE